MLEGVAVVDTRAIKAGPSPRTPPSHVDSGTSAERRSEALGVLRWRVSSLIDAGFSEQNATLIALRPEIDLHRAAGLLSRGCPQLTALRILL